MSKIKNISSTSVRILNSQSVTQEQLVRAAVKKVYSRLKKKYLKTNIKFKYCEKISKKDISSKLSFVNNNFGKYISNNESYIKPDGGFIFALINNKWHLILSAEAKKQGTNDIRQLRGKPIQSKGNAIERAFKNFVEISNYQISEKIFPYLIFISGCDFHSGSSITDRLTAANCQCSINKLYIDKMTFKIDRKTQYKSVASLFIREEQWSVDDIYKHCFLASNLSINHYLKKKTKGKN